MRTPVLQTSAEKYKSNLVPTAHAQMRFQQRGFDTAGLAYVVRYGRVIHRTGIRFYYLAARDVPLADRRNSQVQRLIGTALLVEGETIITAYKNSRALRPIKRKVKYRIR